MARPDILAALAALAFAGAAAAQDPAERRDPGASIVREHIPAADPEGEVQDPEVKAAYENAAREWQEEQAQSERLNAQIEAAQAAAASAYEAELVGYNAARAEYEAALADYRGELADYEAALAAAMVVSIPDLRERLDILNTTTTDVTCHVHRGGGPTGAVHLIRSGGSIRIDGPIEGVTTANVIPINEIQLRCPLVAANALHGGFRSAKRYVIQRRPSGSLELVEVTTSAPAR